MIDIVKSKHEEKLRALSGVVGVGKGKKITNGKMTDEDAIIVFVVKKKPLDALRTDEIVPESLGGIRTDVIESGEIFAQFDPTERHRPAPPGVSIGHYKITAGTLGMWVRHKPTGRIVALTNNHVGANSNDAEIGDPWYQPAPYDEGSPADLLCELADFVPVVFASGNCAIAKNVVKVLSWVATRLGRKTRLTIQQATNTVDCAIGFPIDDADIDLEIPGIGKLKSTYADAEIGMKVQKFGRTTGYTTGTIIALDVTVQVNYGGPIAIFEHQIAVQGIGETFSAGGDSGSGVPEMGPEPVGLLFAGSDQVTIMNAIPYVFSAMPIELI